MKDIIERNSLPEKSVIVLNQYKRRNQNNGALIEVTSDAYYMIMKNKSVFVGAENCKVYDNFNIRKCKNCC